MSTDLADHLPEATPAVPDPICWLWAAFPQRDGRLHISRIAQDLGVSATTIRRWIREADRTTLDDAGQLMIKRRAILRGRGTYQWPDLDQNSRQRQMLQARYAAQVNDTIRAGQSAAKWATDGTLEEHHVAVVQFPRAHDYGVTSARTANSLRRVERYGRIVQTLTVPNRYAAVMLKQATLARVDHARCVVPRELVPTGRTETWREVAGPVRMRRTPAMKGEAIGSQTPHQDQEVARHERSNSQDPWIGVSRDLLITADALA